MRSTAKTVAEYLDEISADRRPIIEAVRKVMLDNLPPGYREVMNWGMICYEIPLETCPDTYNKKPLMYAALASQKNYMTVSACGIYKDSDYKKEFVKKWKATGKKLDMGAACIRFKKLEDLVLDLIGESIAALSVEEYIKLANNCRKK